MPRTTPRTVRVNDDVWLPATDKAYREGVTISDVVRTALLAYLAAPSQGTAQLHPRRRSTDLPPASPARQAQGRSQQTRRATG